MAAKKSDEKREVAETLESVERAAGKATGEIDDFEQLLADDAEGDPAETWGETGEEPEPKEAAKPAEPEPGPAVAPGAAAEAPEPSKDSAEDEESRPEPETIEGLRARAEKLDRDNVGLRRALFRRNERLRLLREADEKHTEEETRQHLEKTMQESIEFEQTPDGRLLLRPEVLQARIDAAVAARTTPPPQTPAQRYQTMRTELLTEFPAETRPAVEAAATQLEEAYLWLDGEVAKELQETGLLPAQLGGMDGLLTFLDESGLSEEFEEKYPGIPIADMVIAPTNRRRARRLVQGILGTRGAPPEEGDREPAGRAEGRPPMPLGSRPRPPAMAGRGRHRAPSAGATLVDLSPDSLFEMSNAEFEAAEKASLEKMRRN